MSENNSIDYVQKFKDFSEKYIPEVDSFIKSFIETKKNKAEYSFISEMYDDLAEYSVRDGKRIRPLLLILSYLGYKKFFNKVDEVVSLGAIVELMHSFLLIQDDIIDRSDTRRGGKALHIISQEKYNSYSHIDTVGRDVALILADILFANSLEVISDADFSKKVKDRFLKIFSETYEMTAWGQILDILHSMPKNIDVEENIPMKVSKMKTAYYTIYYPVVMGYLLTGRNSESELTVIKDFAIPLGLAFQIRDDILGVFGNEKRIGKSADSDILEGKMTLLIQSTVELLKGVEKDHFIEIFTKHKKNTDEVKIIREMIQASGALEQTKNKHKELIEESKKNIDELSIKKESRDILFGVIELIEKI